MKKSTCFMAIMMVLISINTSGQSARKYYKAGVEFRENMKYDDAITQFTSAIGLEPTNPDYYYARGQAYESLLKYDEAKVDYEKVIVFSPKNVDAMIRLGVVYNKKGNYEEALRFLNHASTLDKRNSGVYSPKVITFIGLEKYDQALKASDTALIIKDTPMDYYYRGVVYKKLNNDVLAKKEFEKAISKDKRLPDPRLALADLIITSDPQEAMNQCNEVIRNDARSTEAYLMRSKVYRHNLDYPNAIDDLSKNILINPSNPDFYLLRGTYYQEFSQHTNAIADFSKYISLKADDPEAYFSRAKSYEEIMNFDKAVDDYNKITVLSEFDMKARKMMKDAQARLYEINRENVAPEVTLISPAPVNNIIEIRGDKTSILITGKIKDKSKIKSFLINNESATIAQKNDEYEFLSNVNVEGIDKLSVVAIDDYDNQKTLNYSITRSEINPPLISLVAPYTSEDGQVFLDSPTPNIAIQGKISDESQIKSITIGDVTASYRRDEFNPVFSAILNISNIEKFTVVAEDIYGNKKESEFVLNREGASIATNNPMGKTWVVFVENSSYETFASLDGPIKDVSTMQRALANYQINNIIHKKDMTKAEMEKFFNIELRDLVKKNQVKSLLIWYAGHGKFINDVGYWIPVDAKRDDEFTYFNINALKAGLQGYGDVVVHTLVISDACESGPGFYTAMRSAYDEPKCDNSIVAGARSAQVFSSAGYEIAVDNSKFTSTFANTLMNNKNACIPIETVVKSVTAAVNTETGQKPKFGLIQGLEDMNGTFFFITK
ncbi:MAG: tetratricopeptide repeat protein [Bacteroidales bacterium]|nr:tetratricopeptide repeat protein [Bacteroidales bacterium]